MGDDDVADTDDGGLAQELADLRARNSRLQAENARLLRLLELTQHKRLRRDRRRRVCLRPVRVQLIVNRPRKSSLSSSRRCSPRGLISTPRGGRTRVLVGLGGFRRCVAGGARGYRPPLAITFR